MQMRVGVRVTKRVSSTLQRAFSAEAKRVTGPTRAQGSRMRQSRLLLGRPLVRTFHSKGGPPLLEIRRPHVIVSDRRPHNIVSDCRSAGPWGCRIGLATTVVSDGP